MKIIIADDHPLSLLGTKGFVESLGYTVSDICSNGITAYNLIIAHNPDIAILDINMPGMDALDVLEKLHTNKIFVKVILLTMHREMSIFKRASEYNLFGYLLKNHAEEELALCLKQVISNKRYLSPLIEKELFMDRDENEHSGLEKLSFSEKKILELIGQQKTSRQIADLLFISEKTVEGHRRNIIEKLQLPKEKKYTVAFCSEEFKELKLKTSIS